MRLFKVVPSGEWTVLIDSFGENSGQLAARPTSHFHTLLLMLFTRNVDQTEEKKLLARTAILWCHAHGDGFCHQEPKLEPNSFGKKLGIGMRVAGNIAKDRAQEAAMKAAQRRDASSSTASPSSSAASSPAPGVSPRPSGRQPSVAQVISHSSEKIAERSRNLGHGIGRGSRQFGHSFFRPFAHASSVLWLEVTGCFFALFAAFFAQNIYRVRAQYAAGPEHRTFLLYCLLTFIFAYFSASSFIRARQRSRRQAAGK